MISSGCGEYNLLTDVPGIVVGNASDECIKSGVTVVTAEQPFTAAVQISGGAPGTRETDLLAPDKLVNAVDALVLSGGSALGLDAASGVANALRKVNRGFEINGQRVPLVPAAIIFDLANGGDKQWDNNPYPALGEQAWRLATDRFELGSVGAGTGALASGLKGGLGSASLVVETAHFGFTVAALVVVNPVGSVTVPGKGNFWAAAAEIGAEYGALGSAVDADAYALPERKPLTRENTTLAVVATDAPLDVAQLQRMAIASHDGMARAIYPAHTPFDGDLVFALSTTPVDAANSLNAGDQMILGHSASLCVSRAIARGVFMAEKKAGDVLPTWQDRWGRT